MEMHGKSSSKPPSDVAMCLSLDGEQRSGSSSSPWSAWGLLPWQINKCLWPWGLSAFLWAGQVEQKCHLGQPCWSARISDLLACSSPSLVDPGSQGFLWPLPKPPVTPWEHLPISPTLTSWVRKGWRNWAMEIKRKGFVPLVSCPEAPPGVLVYPPKSSSSPVHGHMVPVRKDFPVCLLLGSLGV